MFKVIVVVMVLVSVGLLVAYYFGGARTFDPTEQGERAKAAIKPGMTWQQIVAAAGKAQGFQTILEKKQRGETTYARGMLVKFDSASLEQEVASRIHPHGFVFTYTFSAQSKFPVTFDKRGVALSVQDEPTLADLLDTRKK